MNPLLIGVCASAVAFAGGGYVGYKLCEGHHAEQTVKAQTKVVTVIQRVAAVNQKVAVQQQAAHDKIVYRTITLTKEVPYAVPAASDFGLTHGWLRLYDASLGLPAASDAPGVADGAPSAVHSADALVTIIANNGTAEQCRSRLEGWQAWATQVAEAQAKP